MHFTYVFQLLEIQNSCNDFEVVMKVSRNEILTVKETFNNLSVYMCITPTEENENVIKYAFYNSINSIKYFN